MLHPDYLIRNLGAIQSLYSTFTTNVLGIIARRLAESLAHYGELQVSATTRHQIAQLQDVGVLRQDIDRQIAKMLGISRVEIADAFNRAAVASLAVDRAVYRQNGITLLPLEEYPQMLRILEARTQAETANIKNLTGTTASIAESQYVEHLNTAFMKVSSGSHSYSQALVDACRDLAKDGIRTYDFTSGRYMALESAVLTGLRTSIGQTAGELTRQSMIDVGASYVQVSAHLGARNVGGLPENHEMFQGKAYYFSQLATEPNTENLPDFVETCGYGDIVGILGINCRHSYSVWFPSQPLVYTNKQLDKMAEKVYIYNGEALDAYKASQKLRNFERNLRNWKRKKQTLESAISGLPDGINREELDVEFSHAKNKVRQASARIKDFVEQTGLTRQRHRERVF